MSDSGTKHDAQKLRYDLLPTGPLRHVVAVLTYGATKYAPGNWQHVEGAQGRYTAALMRHLEAWRGGEACDPESRLHHLAHVVCNGLFLLWFEGGEA